MVGVYTESLVLQVRRRSACQTDTKAPERFPEHGKTNDGIYVASCLCRGGYARSAEQSVSAGILARLHVRRHVSPEGSARAFVVSVVRVVRFCRYDAMLCIYTLTAVACMAMSQRCTILFQLQKANPSFQQLPKVTVIQNVCWARS